MAKQLRYGDPEEAGMSAARIRQLTNRVDQWVSEGRTRALIVLAARRGVVVVHEARGTLTPETDAPPIQQDTIFPLASLMKPLAATAVMCLVEDGLVGLHRPVGEYEPDFVGEGKDAVTVQHLLTHTSGLRGADLNAHAAAHASATIPPPEANQSRAIKEYIFLRRDSPLAKPPGQEMFYSDYHYVLLGDIVRRVTGKTIDAFAAERVFGPLGMRDTGFGLPPARRNRLVRRPAEARTASLEEPDRMDGSSPHTEAFSTAGDLAVFGQMFLQKGSYGPARVLSPASVAAMTRNQTPGIGWHMDDEYFPEVSWGLGWNVQGAKRPGHGPSLLPDQTFEHNGWGGVWLWVDPIHEVVGGYLSLTLGSVLGLYPHWDADLFANAVTAAIDA